MAWVEPGVVLDELNAQLRPHALRFAPDISTASRATIGGMIANNSSGARSILYGKTIDHVLELDVVLADGTLAHFRPLDAAGARDGVRRRDARGGSYRDGAADCAATARRKSSGAFRKCCGASAATTSTSSSTAAKPFNLAKLIVGSEGTLGARRRREAQSGAAAARQGGADDRVRRTARRARRPRRAIVAPSSVRGRGDGPVHPRSRAREPGARCAAPQHPADAMPGALLCVEFYGDRPRICRRGSTRSKRELRRLGYRCRWRRAIAAADQARIWSFREAALGLSMAMKGDAKSLSFVEDTAVAPEKLRDYIERFLQIVQRHGTRLPASTRMRPSDASTCGPVVNMKTADGVSAVRVDRQRHRRPRPRVRRRAVGRARRRPGARPLHAEDVRAGALRSVPGGEARVRSGRRLQPRQDRRHAAVDGEPALRRRLSRRPIRPTFFDYTEHGGMGRAVEMCSGLGVCRKTLDGTMCPSFMATREEKHSTRGRANVLRLAMAGRLGESGLGDEGVRDVLDSVSSAARARPSVRSASTSRDSRASFSPITTAVTARRCGRARSATSTRCRHGQPRRAAGERRRAQRRRPVAQRTAVRDRSPPHAAGVDTPTRSRSSFATEARGQPAPSPQPRRDRLAPSPQPLAPAVVLFTDTFTNYNQPEIGLAAVDVLAAAGTETRLVPHVCCGRPLISQGLLEEARSLAQANADAAVRRGCRGKPHPVPGAQLPFCRSRRRAGAPARRSTAQGTGGRRRVRAVRGLSRTRMGRRGAVDPAAAGPGTVLLHGHCHQKAMGLLPSARALLGRDPVVHRRRSRRGLLRDGRFVRLRARALRRVAPDWRAAVAAGRAGHETRRGPGRGGHVVPASGGAFHRREGGAPGGVAQIAVAALQGHEA